MRYKAYLVTNKITGMQYIGITQKEVSFRWKGHLNKAKNGSNIIFHKAIKEYGENNFIVKHIVSAKTKEDICYVEEKLIYQYNSIHPNGYNCNKGGALGVGYKFTKEQLEKLSKSHIGYKVTQETKVKIANASRGRLHNQLTKIKISKSAKERWKNAEYKKNILEKMKKNALSFEYKQKMKKNLENLKNNPDFYHKWINGRNGVKNSNESKQKMRNSRLNFMIKNPKFGELAGKLKVEEVANIKSLIFLGIKQKEIAKKFNILSTQISNIKTGKCWKNIYPEIIIPLCMVC